MLDIRNLESGYGKLKVLQKISMQVNEGEIVAIIGANGAGKTTLLNTISGIIKTYSGEVIFKDKNISRISAESIVREGCSLVPEGRQIFDTLTVKENLLIGASSLKCSKNALNEKIRKIYDMFPILKDRESQLGGTLSGGEQQMLAISRALMAEPVLIMLDEPSMGLAPLITKNIFEIIKQLKEHGNTILLVEQNAKEALKISDRGYVIDTGRIVLEGKSEDLLNNDEVRKAYLGKNYKK